MTANRDVRVELPCAGRESLVVDVGVEDDLPRDDEERSRLKQVTTWLGRSRTALYETHRYVGIDHDAAASGSERRSDRLVMAGCRRSTARRVVGVGRLPNGSKRSGGDHRGAAKEGVRRVASPQLREQVRVALATARFVLACLALHLAVASQSSAAEPPNRIDPCSSAGRNTCQTLGVGFYDENRYGIRWFGDFRGAVPGKTPMFCIDSRFWYASRAYKYRESSAGALRNRDGEVVPTERQQKIAYAIWRYGQSRKANQQAAVALYVHALMGDARRGETDPTAVNPRVTALYNRIVANTSRYHGPYRIETRVSAERTVGKTAFATVRVLSAAGNALPDVPLKLVGQGAISAPADARTGPDGAAVVPLTLIGAGQSNLRIETAPLASTLPKIFLATTQPAAANAQRLAAPASQRETASTSLTVRAQPIVSTVVSTEIAGRGTQIFDRIRVEGLGNTGATIDVELFGPFATRSAIRCQGRPLWKGSVVIDGDGEIRSPTMTPRKAGFYTYRERLIGTSVVNEFTTECPLAVETTLVPPRILAGGATAPTHARVPDGRRSRPVRVQLPSVGVDAQVLPVGIDVDRGVLGTPKDIRRAGWWKDGGSPGARSGAVLIAGHVDSAQGGAGAFLWLHKARTGDKIHIRAASGRTFTYRVASVRSHHKDALPTSIYSSKGAPRLVLVTCGGPFNHATGHYRDNIVVTAVR
jgi:Sortase domain